MQPVADRRRHELMPGRVELHLIDPVPVPVVSAKHGGVHIGLPGQLGCLGRAGQATKFMQFGQHRLAVLGLDGSQQNLIGRYVVPGKRWYLVADFMGRPDQV